MNIHNTISDYEQFNHWTQSTLQPLSDHDWHRPIQDGKASIAEIIAHLRNWDLHLIDVVIPSIMQGGGIEFPDFNVYNSKAYEHANSGVSKNDLLQEFSDDRKKLIDLLRNMTWEDLLFETTANGVTHCPHTGQPYSLLYIIHEFIEHDEHHKKQMIDFLHDLQEKK
ncbi:DinB family protein [Paenibacillus qinlingensis]|uniref:DinB-like domain-containing protein n=1 Tax=Paenibacillus qinlingensis TaxID=1837343 RepID=A0ABU1NST8_9BACL|nr:DinB family protein [Paenibacillus qinlingensis]MDR6550131.1 hypothetical protein [Paenibacillus qinlingensis]